MKKYFFKRVIALAMVTAMIFTVSCGKRSHKGNATESQEQTTSKSEEQSTDSQDVLSIEEQRLAFDNFLLECFKELVSEDSISLAFTLKEPSAYGIAELQPAFGDISEEYFKKNEEWVKDKLNKLTAFKCENLSDQQQYDYKVFENYLKDDLASSKYYIYVEPLSPISGLQSELPIVLCEYPIYDEKDVETVLALIGQLPDYFKKIAKFEELKAEKGCLMSKSAAEEVLEQCKKLQSKEGYEPIINSLWGNISNSVTTGFFGISKSKVSAAVEKAFPEAFGYLVDMLEQQLSTYSFDEKGLSATEASKEYYKALIKSYTGTDLSIEELIELIETSLKNDMSKIYILTLKDPNISEKLESYTFPYENDPKEALNYLATEITKYFPAPKTVEFSVKNVAKELEDMMSPAFYMIPQIDAFDRNIIYINGSSEYQDMDLFPTLAHEGFPGHMYQTTYYFDTKPQPIRNVLNFIGYQEGWAKYTELLSYEMAGLDENVAKLLQIDQSFGFGLYCRIDAGIHYEGWDYDKTEEFLKPYGIMDKETIDELYYTLLNNPGVYMQYYIGFLELQAMAQEAKDTLGDKFSYIDFHKFILDIGPSQFYLIREEFEKWLAEKS